MATYQFSALADGQTISFNPNVDVLNFDQTAIAAADVLVSPVGADLRISVGAKDVLLTNVSSLQLAITNISFADGSRLLFGDNTSGTANDNAANALTGTAGRDQLAGFGGADTLNGGAGNDVYVVGTGDVISDSSGNDTVLSDISWSLGTGLENLTLTGTANISAQGNSLDNLLQGNSGGNYFNGRAGNDTILAGNGNDTIDMSTGGTQLQGNDSIDGGSGTDTLDYDGYALSAVVADLAAGQVTGGGNAGEGSASISSIERFVGGAFNDRITGNFTNNYLDGRGGNDTLDGGTSNDTLIGGAGADTFIFSTAPNLGNADQVTDFVSGTDKLVLDRVAYSAIGASGTFAAGDARFWASASGTAHDADDRVIYNTANGQLWYDADGNGAGAAQLIATLQGTPTLAATDIAAQGEAGQHVVGTAGDDVLAGGEGDDTIEGLGGNDDLYGHEGNDLIQGGDGNDRLNNGAGNDTLLGGAGNDTIFTHHPHGTPFGQDVYDGGIGHDHLAFSDADGPVTVNLATGTVSGPIPGDSATITGVEDISGAGFADHLIGDANANAIWGMGGSDTLDGGAGNDTLEGGGLLIGGDGNDSLRSFNANTTMQGGTGDDVLQAGISNDVLAGDAGNDIIMADYGNDTISGGAGSDKFIFEDADAASADQITDFASGTDELRIDATRFTFEAMPAGDFVAGDARFHAAAGASGGHDADDRIIYNTTTRQVFYDADGSGSGAAQLLATLQAGATLVATDIGVDGGTGTGLLINGTAGNDSLVGSTGNDTINGLAGNDTIHGLAGNDSLSGGDGNDYLTAGSQEGQVGGDFLSGGAGDDTLEASAWWDSVAGDTLDGGTGNDTYHVDHSGDTLIDAGGVDLVIAHDMDWTLGDGFENFHLNNGVSEGAGSGTGNALDNVMSVAWGGELDGRGGNDTLWGSGQGDHLIGGDGNDALRGFEKSDRLDGGAGNDTLTGDSSDGMFYFDRFAFTAAPGAANADLITDFVSIEDRIHLDAGVMPALGFSGNFMAGDERFHSAAGATGGHDADDRVIYDTATGRLYYDADGSGTAAAQLLATLQGAPTLAATDIWVDNGVPGATLTGTTGNDSLAGTGGDDSISGLAGNDTLQGLDGQDTLDGGDGSDRVEGGRGNDQIFGGGGGDTVSGGMGVDTISAGFSGADISTDVFVFDVAPGMDNYDSISNFVVNQDRVVLDSTIFAAAGPAGNFSAGDGRFYASTTATEGHDADDRIIYNQNNGNLYYDADGSGSGAALLIANLRNDLNAVNLSATDIWLGMPGNGQSITGTAGNDSLTGTAANDTISGLAGNDTLRGLAGSDSLMGGDGNDDLDGGGGGDDTLIGGAGADILRGVSSDSPRRAEVLDGGLGNDEYHIDRWEDTLIDAGGVDLVVLHDTSYRLEAGFENLRVEGSENAFWAASGNELDNHMTVANSIGAQLFGAGGNDTLMGGAGAQRDFLTGGAGNDSLVGNAGDDYLHGGDTMSGSLGTDTLIGGAGNDRYIVGVGDVLVEAAGGGIDSVESEVSWTLGADFENLTLLAGGVTANGNGLNNVLTGNDANNSSINGRAGNDTMFGMGGNDVFDMSTGGTSSYGTDVIDGGAGTDSVEFGPNARSAVNINLTAGTVSGGGDGGAGSASLTSVENALGGNFNDTITGSSGANLLRGSSGNDTLNGKGGVDNLNGGAGNDAFVFDLLGSANRDIVQDFATGVDKLHMENAVMTAIGATGNFAAGDARFWAAAGATAGHDANDRIVYNSTTGDLYYDADGSGAGAAQFVANISGHPALAATDIAVI